jgi:hypothetical protein
MVLYNVTVKISNTVKEDWLKWMKETHIPDVMDTGFFQEHKICRLLGEDESEGTTFAIQYIAKSLQDFAQYNEQEAPRLQKEHSNRYKNQYVAFRTLMEIL